jgi:HlyD family secretion protein
MQKIETETSLRRFQLMGFASMAVVMGLFGGWAALASINGAVIAPATVAVETSTKRIQHKEGGIVRELLVKDGDRVSAGQPLVVLDDTEFRAELGIVEALWIESLAKRARLEAQRDRLSEIVFPPEVLAPTGVPAVGKIVSDQVKLFQAGRASLAAKRQQFEEQIGQLGEQITGYLAQQTSKERQIALLDDELAGLRKLLADGLVQVTRVLAMERERARLEGERGELVSARAGAESKITEVRIQMSELDDRDRTETLAELRDAGSRAAELFERRLAAASKVERSVIRAPVDGDVY